MSEQLINELKDEIHRIFNFWRLLRDEKNGGFYSKVDYNLTTERGAQKSGVAAARNLWSFSKAYRLTSKSEYLKLADHAYAFFVRHLVDSLHGGIYWMLDYDGDVIDTRKHIYMQAFSIYALSEYYLATGNRRSIELAMKIWTLIEEKGYNSETGAYKEEFSREWKEPDNELLSENGIIADITSNTHLHGFEAYTSLYKAVPTKPVRESLLCVLDIFEQRIYSPEDKCLKVFFDADWKEVIDLKSYGHDLEASWLIDAALKVLNLKNEKYTDMVRGLAEQVLQSAVQTDGSVINECEDGEEDDTRLWWVQAEAVVGFFNAWERTGEEKYYTAFVNLWSYIRESIIDHRPGGEWLYGRNSDGNPLNCDIVDAWKTPYHNSRCCMELYARLSK